MSGKGSKQRPLSVSRSTFEDNWAKIFNTAPQGDSNDNRVHEKEKPRPSKKAR